MEQVYRCQLTPNASVATELSLPGCPPPPAPAPTAGEFTALSSTASSNGSPRRCAAPIGYVVVAGAGAVVLDPNRTCPHRLFRRVAVLLLIVVAGVVAMQLVKVSQY